MARSFPINAQGRWEPECTKRLKTMNYIHSNMFRLLSPALSTCAIRILFKNDHYRWRPPRHNLQMLPKIQMKCPPYRPEQGGCTVCFFIKLSFDEFYFCYERVSTSLHVLSSFKNQRQHVGQYAGNSHAKLVVERKRKRSASVLWQKPIHQQKCQKGKVTT